MLFKYFSFYLSSLVFYPISLAAPQPLPQAFPTPQSFSLSPNLKNHVLFKSLPDLYPLARQMKRKFVFYMGPTNSGKTHAAMEALKQANTGVYLSPLRLLALEVWQRMEEAGISTNLVTGEEIRETLGAMHTSQTIETLALDRRYDVAVIDEVQMLTDISRGGAWTAAILGTAAETIYLCGSKNALPAIESLVKMTGDTLEVHELQRLTPLEVASKPQDLKHIPKKGTAIVCFSKRDVLEWRDKLRALGFRVAVIYGNLSPEVREEQARMFRDGEVDILVATDAIGMGLNLPLERVVFSQTTKYDGIQDRSLTASEMRQIGGRAGRYGMYVKEGVVTAFNADDLKSLKRAFQGDLNGISSADLIMSPSFEHIQAIAKELDTNSLTTVLNVFISQIEIANFKKADLSDRIELVRSLDRVRGASLEDKFVFSLVPIESDNKEHISMLTNWLNSYVNGYTVVPENFIKTRTWSNDSEMEETRKIITAYRWISLRYPTIASSQTLQTIEYACENVDEALMKLLKKNSQPIKQKNGKKKARFNGRR